MAVWVDEKALCKLLTTRFGTIAGVTLLYPIDPIPAGAVAQVCARFDGLTGLAYAKQRRNDDEIDVVTFTAQITVWAPPRVSETDGWELETACSKVRIAMCTSLSDSPTSDHIFTVTACERTAEAEQQPDEDRRSVMTITGTCQRKTGATLT